MIRVVPKQVRAVFLLSLLCLASPAKLLAQAVDATSLNNKILAGYQGWFRTPGDNPNNIDQGWSHLFGRNFKPGFDTWPDMSELDNDEKFAVPGFTKPDGSPAYLYSAQNPKTVLRHFKWMQQYDIDGVWLSQFCDHFPGGRQQSDSTTVYTIMNNVRAAATATGRTWAFMWDMSGFGPNTSKSEVYDIIITNWKKMVDRGITSDPRYLHHDGKPVLLIWGFFPDRPASQPDHMAPVVDLLLAPGKYQAALVAGADNKWRTGTPEFQAMLMRMTALQPWSVGRARRDQETGYKVPFTGEWAEDIAKCKANNVLFIPVINSGTHIAGPPPTPPAVPVVPRRTGNYLWQQFVTASQTGVINSAFIAMFDEINEGTQIMKIDNHPPVQYPFLTYDGATSDYYLRLLGAAGKLLKNKKPITFPIPVSPFSLEKKYEIKNIGNSKMLDQITGGSKTNWQLIYDGDDHFVIKDLASGKVLGIAANNNVTLVKQTKQDNVKWHLEWDGSGNCRIINKSKALTLAAGANEKETFTLITAPTKPEELADRNDLRWQITEQ